MDALSSWTDGAARTRILDFVARVTTEGSPDFVDPAERIAVFDNDGTLWCEKPMPIQLDFTIRRLAEIAAADPDRRERQPWKAAHEHDTSWLGGAMVKHYHGDDADLHLLMGAVTEAFDAVTVEDYGARVASFFDTANHPTLHRPYRGCGFEPMVELLGHLTEHGFTTYIASGGDRDFMRPVAEALYGVPPERVVGSALGLTYQAGELLYEATMDFFDDGPEKPVRIWSRLGRRPLLAAGNSNGDLEMLEFTGLPGGPTMRLLVNHDDGEREFAYTAGAEQALARARDGDWTVVSMKDDWHTVFAEPDR